MRLRCAVVPACVVRAMTGVLRWWRVPVQLWLLMAVMSVVVDMEDIGLF